MQKNFAVVLLAVIVPFNLFAAPRSAKTSVVSAGTKVAAATANTLVDAECQESYFGCMDAFCIVENVSGGRCQCSNKHIQLSAKLKEIMDMDNQAYAISTYGTEHVELGKAAEEVLASSERAFDKAIRDANDESVVGEKKPEKKSTLSFAEWNSSFSKDEEEDVFELDADDIANKKGDELYKAAMGMCFEQTPQKCKASEDMLKMLYVQKIRSDCAAFENSLNKQESESTVKLEDAKRDVREAALTEVQNANKYNLGECALEFKKCMQGDDVCGNDWTGCVKLAAAENMENNKSGSVASQVQIAGKFSVVTIAATTMDSLLAKKPLCEHITDQCAREKDKVWDVFVKDIVPTIKSVELAAESDLRTSCLSNVSQCYVKACKENMDPKDPEGSYDMCLSQPDNYKAFCKVELEPCLHATGGTYDKPDSSSLWRGILAKLSSMRVDACTQEFKTCIQDKDRCGEDYSQCIGFDNEAIATICPEDKLTACYKQYGNNEEKVRDMLARTAQGIFLNVDNSLLAVCEKAVTDAIVKYCGDEYSCNGLIDDNLGSRSLNLQFCEPQDDSEYPEYKNCRVSVDSISDIELGKTTRGKNLVQELHEQSNFTGVLSGIIDWKEVKANQDGRGLADLKQYISTLEKIPNMTNETLRAIQSELGAISEQIKQIIDVIESDPRITYCTTGRELPGLKDSEGFSQFISKKGNPRFPNMMNRYRKSITTAAIQKVRDTYYNKYDELYEQKVIEELNLWKRVSKIQGLNNRQNMLDVARKSCIELAEGKKPKFLNDKAQLSGSRTEVTVNVDRTVNSIFNMGTGICNLCVRESKCEDVRFVDDAGLYCHKWGEVKETCQDIEFFKDE
jgi:hypothetical protein